jgi:hypothetical protein
MIEMAIPTALMLGGVWIVGSLRSMWFWAAFGTLIALLPAIFAYTLLFAPNTSDPTEMSFEARSFGFLSLLVMSASTGLGAWIRRKTLDAPKPHPTLKLVACTVSGLFAAVIAIAIVFIAIATARELLN